MESNSNNPSPTSTATAEVLGTDHAARVRQLDRAFFFDMRNALMGHYMWLDQQNVALPNATREDIHRNMAKLDMLFRDFLNPRMPQPRVSVEHHFEHFDPVGFPWLDLTDHLSDRGIGHQYWWTYLGSREFWEFVMAYRVLGELTPYLRWQNQSESDDLWEMYMFVKDVMREHFGERFNNEDCTSEDCRTSDEEAARSGSDGMESDPSDTTLNLGADRPTQSDGSDEEMGDA